MDEAKHAELRRFMEEAIPFNRFLGIRVLEAGPERVRLHLPFRPELIGDPVRRALHGGVLSTLVDTAGGLAAYVGLNPDERVSTVDLVVDYLRPGAPEDLVATGRVVRRGNRVCVCAVEVAHLGGDGSLVAQGRGVYNIHHP